MLLHGSRFTNIEQRQPWKTVITFSCLCLKRLWLCPCSSPTLILRRVLVVILMSYYFSSENHPQRKAGLKIGDAIIPQTRMCKVCNFFLLNHSPRLYFFSSRNPLDSNTEAIKIYSPIVKVQKALISAVLALGFRRVPHNGSTLYHHFLPCPLGTFFNSTSKGAQGCTPCPPGNWPWFQVLIDNNNWKLCALLPTNPCFIEYTTFAQNFYFRPKLTM